MRNTYVPCEMCRVLNDASLVVNGTFDILLFIGGQVWSVLHFWGEDAIELVENSDICFVFFLSTHIVAWLRPLWLYLVMMKIADSAKCLLPSQNSHAHSSCPVLTASLHPFYIALHTSWTRPLSVSLFPTVRQRSRELRQVLHPHSAAAHTSRRAGYRLHRPGRVRRVLVHQPTVCEPGAHQPMRRMGKPPRRTSLLTATHLKQPPPTWYLTTTWSRPAMNLYVLVFISNQHSRACLFALYSIFAIIEYIDDKSFLWCNDEQEVLPYRCHLYWRFNTTEGTRTEGCRALLIDATVMISWWNLENKLIDACVWYKQDNIKGAFSYNTMYGMD